MFYDTIFLDKLHGHMAGKQLISSLACHVGSEGHVWKMALYEKRRVDHEVEKLVTRVTLTGLIL